LSAVDAARGDQESPTPSIRFADTLHRVTFLDRRCRWGTQQNGYGQAFATDLVMIEASSRNPREPRLWSCDDKI
jgi:hypothetical protein